MRLRDLAPLLAAHLPADDPLASYAGQLTGALGDQSLRGYLSGSIDVVLRVPGDPAEPHGHRYVVVDYKTNLLGETGVPVTSADYGRAEMAAAMLHSHYPLQALLYSVVLHRYLRWRLPSYAPEQHLGGVLYLFLRGMCGPETPVVDGHVAGVFDWSPPAALVTDLSDLLEGRRMIEPFETDDPRDRRFALGRVRACSAASTRPASSRRPTPTPPGGSRRSRASPTTTSPSRSP